MSREAVRLFCGFFFGMLRDGRRALVRAPVGHTRCLVLACRRFARGTTDRPMRRRRQPARESIRQIDPVEGFMLRYAVIFFIIAIIAAFFGFGGIASGATEIAKILFFIFIVIFLATLLLGVFRR
jgi:uncharacterized membrane protein YtjA (UPF0391 family)